MHQYGVREVEKLLRLPRSTIRAYIDAGFVTPQRGARNALLFSFQDLIVLRTAQSLAAANVPRRRITRSMKELRRQLPDEMPLTGLSIGAIGDQVVVKEGGARWQADTGQYLLAFEVDPASGAVNVCEKPARAAVAERAPQAPDAAALYDEAVRLEVEDIELARGCYEKAIALDPTHLDARVNLGLLHHEAGRHADAERTYRAAIATCGPDPVLCFNLAILLEDVGKLAEAKAAYESALLGDPKMADCHYNLALLCEKLQKPHEAIRHMAQYRRLTRK
ncbi:MAG TPA: tetratricopeptide repeat protein [Xanthomonadales bacterium]|nr:tetratricopeptide repeat protein [Xanthomonadales bacterium]